MTVSLGGTRPASAADDSPIRGRISVTSTAPSRSPRTCTRPEVGNICADAICSRVVLPAPFGPRITQRSSTSTFQFTASSSTDGPRRTVTSIRCSTESGPGMIDGATGRATGLEVTRRHCCAPGSVTFRQRGRRGGSLRFEHRGTCDRMVGENRPMPHRPAAPDSDSSVSPADLFDDVDLPSAPRRPTSRRCRLVDLRDDAASIDGTSVKDVTPATDDHKAGKKKRKGKGRGRPGQIDPQAAPRVGSSPFPGLPYPLGATPYEGGTNFAVVADGIPGVSDVQLCLIDRDGTERRYPMAERTYGIWHTFVPDIGPGQVYGFRVPARDPSKILLDPYARQITTTEYDLVAAASHRRRHAGQGAAGRGHHRDRPAAPLRFVRPWVPWEQTVIYEAHVVGLTQLHPGRPGRVAGHLQGGGPPGRHRASEESVGDHAGTAAGAGQRRRARPARHRSAELLGLLDSQPISRRIPGTPPTRAGRSRSSSRWSTRCTRRASRSSWMSSTTTPVRAGRV